MKNNKKNEKFGFTLVELVVVIFIIAVISTLITVSFLNIRRMNRDSKRITDIVDIQMTLENYKFFEGSYPEELTPGQSLIGTTTGNTYMSLVPNNANYIDYNCPWSNYEYYYDAEKEEYEISFCLEGDIKKNLAGVNCAISSGIFNQYCPNEAVGYVFSCGDSFLDNRDGNIYPTVEIGSQCWLAKNLAYLPIVHSDSEFVARGTSQLPGYGVYNYNGSNILIAKSKPEYNSYGVYYNWYAVNQTGENAICPSGWSVPDDSDSSTLITYLQSNSNYWCNESSSYLGKSLASNSLWNSSDVNCAVGNNRSSNNVSNFNALPTGHRSNSQGTFYNIGEYTGFWLSISDGMVIYLNYNEEEIITPLQSKIYGLSVRCIKD